MGKSPAVLDGVGGNKPTRQEAGGKAFTTFLLTFVLLCGLPVFAQEPPTPEDQEAVYTRSINQRAEKIVASLGIPDATKTRRVQPIIAQQYRDLREIHAERDTRIKSIKASGDDKAITEERTQTVQRETQTKLDALHREYLAKLSAELTPEQVDGVKDGMTYGVVPLTYRLYQEMLPGLTDAQKAQILAWLTEAREKAMDAGTSQEKHAWFGKYKGRINNYLSAAGYDLKKAEREYQERRKAASGGKPE